MYKILIVDDNPNNIYTLKSVLSKLDNCEIIEAQSGYEVLSIVLKEEIRLIILDIQMPDMDGFEVAELLKEKESTKDIPIIFLTAVFKSEDFQEHGYKLGAVDYLTKPINENILLNKIHLYLTLFDRDDKLLKSINELEAEVKLRKEHEESLKAINTSLSELERAKTLFIASMSHELRTPLNAIIGFTSVVLREMIGPLNDKQKDHLERSEKAAKHLLELVIEILDISKIEAEEIYVTSEPLDLLEMFHEALETVKEMAKKKKLLLEVKLEHSLEIETDRKLLQRCLNNLLTNAIKYSETGTITLNAVWKGNDIELSVTDTGLGIDAKEIPKIFKPFERLESHMKILAGGTGLGLYLTKKIAEDILGGKVFVESKKGVGSTFVLVLPKKMS